MTDYSDEDRAALDRVADMIDRECLAVVKQERDRWQPWRSQRSRQLDGAQTVVHRMWYSAHDSPFTVRP